MLLFRESVRGKWLKRKGQRRGRKAISGEISWYQTQQVHRSQKRSSSYLPTAQPLVPHAGAASAQWWRVWGIAWRGTKSKGGLSREGMRMKSQQIFNKSQDERTLQKGVSRKNSAGKTGHPYAENETISYLSPYTKLNQKKKKRIKDNKCKTWNYPTIWGKRFRILEWARIFWPWSQKDKSKRESWPWWFHQTKKFLHGTGSYQQSEETAYTMWETGCKIHIWQGMTRNSTQEERKQTI